LPDFRKSRLGGLPAVIATSKSILFGALEQRVKRQGAFISPPRRRGETVENIIIRPETARILSNARPQFAVVNREAVRSDLRSAADQRRIKCLYPARAHRRHREALSHDRLGVTEREQAANAIHQDAADFSEH